MSRFTRKDWEPTEHGFCKHSTKRWGPAPESLKAIVIMGWKRGRAVAMDELEVGGMNCGRKERERG